MVMSFNRDNLQGSGPHEGPNIMLPGGGAGDWYVWPGDVDKADIFTDFSTAVGFVEESWLDKAAFGGRARAQEGERLSRWYLQGAPWAKAEK
jgi:hypothetical protein